MGRYRYPSLHILIWNNQHLFKCSLKQYWVLGHIKYRANVLWEWIPHGVLEGYVCYRARDLLQDYWLLLQIDLNWWLWENFYRRDPSRWSTLYIYLALLLGKSLFLSWLQTALGKRNTVYFIKWILSSKPNNEFFQYLKSLFKNPFSI